MKARGLQVAAATTVAAVFLWGFVKLGGQYETSVAVRIEPHNIPAGFAPTSALPQTVHLVLQGDGLHLVLYLWNADLELPLDMKGAAGGQRALTMKEVTRMLKFPGDIEVLTMTPDTLFLMLEQGIEKKVPVVLEADLSFADGFGLAERPVISPESITVRGAESAIDPVTSWKIGPLVFHDVTQSFEQRVVVGDSSSSQTTFSPSSLLVTFNVQPFAEKSVSEIPVKVLSVPPNREVVLIPSRIEILVRGAIEHLAELSADECRAYVEFDRLTADTIRSVAPRVELPEGLTLIAKNPEKLQFIIRRRL